jgi:DNA invertase Pin-like site-specific DNA recombinase
VKLSIGGSVHDPADPMGKLLFNVLTMVPEADLIRARTREGLKVAKAKGRLRGKQPKLSPRQKAHLVKLHTAGDHTMYELAELFSVGRSTCLSRRRTGAPEDRNHSRLLTLGAAWANGSKTAKLSCEKTAILS